MHSHTPAHPRVVVRATDPSELLAALPYVLGYHPQESVVVTAVDGGRLGTSARLDVAAVVDDPAGTGRHIATTLARTGVTTVLMVVYSCAPPVWLEGFVLGLADAGLRLRSGWQVDSGAYWPLEDPQERQSTDQLQSSVVSAQLVAAGLAPAARREGLLDDLRPYPEAVRARLHRYAEQIGEPAQMQERLVEAVNVWAGWLGDPTIEPPPPGRGRTPRRPLSDRHMALLLAAVNVPAFRDAVIAATVSPGLPLGAGLEALAGDVRGFLPPSDGGPAQRPDQDRVEAAVELLGHLVRATGGGSALLLALLAQVHWWAGNGVVANLLVERALDVNPMNRLANLMEGLLTAAVPPPWVPCATPEEQVDRAGFTGPGPS